MLHSWLNLQMWNHKHRGTADAEELVHIYIDMYIYTHIYVYTHTHTAYLFAGCTGSSSLGVGFLQLTRRAVFPYGAQAFLTTEHRLSSCGTQA